MAQRFHRAARRVAAAALALLIAALAAVPAAANDDGLMAHNIYSNPDVSRTSGGYDTFLIDFRGVQTPDGTYWALANFSMDLRGSARSYPSASGGGAYAGLQATGSGRKGILSFWEIKYRGDKILRAERVYPAGGESTFGGEGEGTNYITAYPWKDNEWYRMCLHCWADAETKTTFVGQWFQEVSSGKWTLLSYFDTKLTDSFLTGGMGQFMENFSAGNADPEREFNYKNLYVLDHEDKEWKSLSKSTLSYDTGFNNKRGSHEIGATDEYFWGKASGLLPEGASQEEYDRESLNNKSYTIKQPAAPTFADPAVSRLALSKNSKEWKVSWTLDETGSPMQSYKLELLDASGNVLAEESSTRPGTNRATFDLSVGEAASVRLSVTDIFGGSCVAEEALRTSGGGGSAGETGGADDAPSGQSEGGADAGKLSTGVILALAAGIILAIVVVCAILLARKKKNPSGGGSDPSGESSAPGGGGSGDGADTENSGASPGKNGGEGGAGSGESGARPVENDGGGTGEAIDPGKGGGGKK